MKTQPRSPAIFILFSAACLVLLTVGVVAQPSAPVQNEQPTDDSVAAPPPCPACQPAKVNQASQEPSRIDSVVLINPEPIIDTSVQAAFSGWPTQEAYEEWLRGECAAHKICNPDPTYAPGEADTARAVYRLFAGSQSKDGTTVTIPVVMCPPQTVASLEASRRFKIYEIGHGWSIHWIDLPNCANEKEVPTPHSASALSASNQPIDPRLTPRETTALQSTVGDGDETREADHNNQPNEPDQKDAPQKPDTAPATKKAQEPTPFAPAPRAAAKANAAILELHIPLAPDTAPSSAMLSLTSPQAQQSTASDAGKQFRELQLTSSKGANDFIVWYEQAAAPWKLYYVVTENSIQLWAMVYNRSGLAWNDTHVILRRENDQRVYDLGRIALNAGQGGVFRVHSAYLAPAAKETAELCKIPGDGQPAPHHPDGKQPRPSDLQYDLRILDLPPVGNMQKAGGTSSITIHRYLPIAATSQNNALPQRILEIARNQSTEGLEPGELDANFPVLIQCPTFQVLPRLEIVKLGDKSAVLLEKDLGLALTVDYKTDRPRFVNSICGSLVEYNVGHTMSLSARSRYNEKLTVLLALATNFEIHQQVASGEAEPLQPVADGQLAWTINAKQSHVARTLTVELRVLDRSNKSVKGSSPIDIRTSDEKSLALLASQEATVTNLLRQFKTARNTIEAADKKIAEIVILLNQVRQLRSDHVTNQSTRQRVTLLNELDAQESRLLNALDEVRTKKAEAEFERDSLITSTIKACPAASTMPAPAGSNELPAPANYLLQKVSH